MDATSKRERPDSGDGNAVDSKRRKEMDSFQPVIRRKAKPCTRFFSTTGCPYGEDCHYLHYFPGGLQAVQRMAGLNNNPAALVVPPASNPFAPPVVSSSHAPIAAAPPSLVHLARLTSKISVDTSIAGLIIGEGRVNVENICSLTGARLSIQARESDLNLRTIELEGTYDQINPASVMVRDLIDDITASAAKFAGSNRKTKICRRFSINGFCGYGNRCGFAHGESELQKGRS